MLGDQTVPATAKIEEGAERDRLWDQHVAALPWFGEYRRDFRPPRSRRLRPTLPPMTTQEQRDAADRVRGDRAFWRELVSEVGRDRMLEPGPMGEWTFKDLAAHLAAWRNTRIPMIEAAGRGQPTPSAPWPAELADDDFEAINDWFQRRDADRSLDDVLDDYDRSFERLAAAIEALPDAVARDPSALTWTRGEASALDIDFLEHLHEDHLPDVRAWLDRTA